VSRARQAGRGGSPYDVGIGSPAFHIEIVEQGWIAPASADYDAVARDLCSHGDIRLTIAGETIAAGDGAGEYGISEAALGLLRTLESDTPDGQGEPFADRLIPHGCGAILMRSCPIGIDWAVRHVDGRVRIGDVVKHVSIDDSEAVRFPHLVVELPIGEYRDEIISFALRAKEPFEGIEKSFSDDFDRQSYADFWEEYGRLLEGAVRETTRSSDSPSDRR
jgi:hypothetical protein